MALITNNISGSVSDSWQIGITGSVRIGNPGANPFPGMPGSDVSFFVSGSQGGKGSSGVSVFGGDTVVSGSLTVGTGSITVTSNDITFFGGVAQILSGSGGLTFKDSSGTVTVSDIVGGAFGQPVYWDSTTSGVVSTTGSVEIAGDLTVNGTTTTISTNQLVIEDPLVYFGSGSTSTNNNGGIALASGSSVTDQALVWGRVAPDTWGAGRKDVAGGIDADLTTGVTLVSVRSSDFQVAGSDNALKIVSTNLFISASNSLGLQVGTGQSVRIQENTTEILRVQSGSFSESVNSTRIAAQSGKGLLVGGSDVVGVSGSAIYLQAGTSGVIYQRDGGPVFSIASPNATTLTMNPSAGLSTTNLVNANSTTVNFAGAATTLAIGNSTTVAQTLNLGTASTGSSTYNIGTGATANGVTKTLNIGTGGVAGSTTNINLGNANGGTVIVNNNFSVNGNTVLGNAGSDTITVTGVVSSNIIPDGDVTRNLGSAAARWANIYTGDLHLRNDRGDWTIIEEETFLSITNNKTGKRYKFVMEEI